LLGCLERHANKYKRRIVPLLSLSIDYYIRVFVRVFTSPGKVKESASKMGHVLQCVGCETHEIVPMMRLVEATGKKGTTYTKYKLGQFCAPEKCTFCGKPFQMAGPVWIDPLMDKAVLTSLKTHL